MRVVHGPNWLAEIEWYYDYTQPNHLSDGVVFSTPVKRFPTGPTVVTMKLVLCHPLREVRAEPIGRHLEDKWLSRHQIEKILPLDICQALLRLPERYLFLLTGWSAGKGFEWILIQAYVDGELQHFDAFLRSVVRKLLG